MSEPILTAEHVLSMVGHHQSRGRKTVYAFMGARDLEEGASGCFVTGRSGKRYLDFGGYAVFLLGHRREEIVTAVKDQLDRMPLSSRLLPSEVNATAARTLAGLAPERLSKVAFFSAGAEAVEAALKMARAVTGRSCVAHLRGSFHGKTMGALSLTDSDLLRAPFAPTLESIVLPRDNESAAVEMVLRARPAAVFCEAVQGEGGIYELAPSYLRSLRAASSSAGALLICDEIQSGLGRTGSMWAFQPSGIEPDLILAGKALGGGVMPVSAVLASPEAFAAFDRDPFLHTSTFGGNPLACAAARAAVEVIQKNDVPGLARSVGEVLRELLVDLAAGYPHLFAGVSGRGLMLGLHARRAEIAGLMIRAALREGLMITPCITSSAVIRITPSAFVGPSELGQFAEAVHAAAREVESNLKPDTITQENR